jgi:hypothetical protein
MKDASGALDRVAGYIQLRQERVTIDEHLVRLITQIMAAYLKLCLIYAKVDKNSKTASGRTKNGFKALIGWDGGIGQIIEEIEKLSRQELVSNIAAMRVSELSTAERRSKVEDSLKLRSLLQVDETGEHWAERQKQLEQESLPGIGEWLLDEPGKFKEWASNIQERPKDAILWLTGPAIYGKTHICCRAIQYLRKEIESGNRYRHCQTSVAWFYHQEKRPLQSKSSDIKKEDKDGTDKKKRTGNATKKEVPELRDILLALIWQLAENDRSFQKYVIEQFRRTPRGYAKASQLWSNLIEPFCLQPQTGDSRPHCFFLIIDADDASNNRVTKSLTRTMQDYADSLSKKALEKQRFRCHIRVMIARAKDAPLGAHEIKVPQDTPDSDVQKFIEHHLKDFFSAWSKGSEGYRLVRSLERRLIQLFSTGDTVNYHVLAGLLEEISRIGKDRDQLRKFEKEFDPDNIEQVFNSVIIPTQLKRLDDELGDEDKRILNDVISYLVCVTEWPTTEQLGAFLSLSRGSSFTKNIEAEIREKYSHIMTIDSDKYVTSNRLYAFFGENFRQKPWHARREESEGDKIIEAHKVGLAKLVASTPDVVTLTNFITEILKGNAARPKLRFDYQQSHIMIIKVFLSTICSDDHRERAAVTELQAYTGMNVLWHLWNLKRDKSLEDVITDVTSKRTIGKHLYHFFMEETSVRAWLSQSNPLYLREYTCAYLEDARGWLEDSDVWAGFKEGRFSPKDDQKISTTQREIPAHQIDTWPLTGLPEEPSAISLKMVNDTHEGVNGKSLEHIQTVDTAGPASDAQRKEVPLEEGKPTEETTTEPVCSGASATTSDQTKSDVVNQPLLALVVRVSASLWLEDLKWDASQAFLWLITVANEVSVSYFLTKVVEKLIELERRLDWNKRTMLLGALSRIKTFSNEHTIR